LIPRVAHFVWLGAELPWVHLLAVASARSVGGFDQVRFHHTDELADTPPARVLGALDRVVVERLEPEALLERAGATALIDTYRALGTPAAKSNVLRVALLREHGGVYLDTDTVTLKSFEALCARGGAFCGEERLVFPAHLGAPARSRLRPSALVRTLARDVMRRLPNGYQSFRRIEHLYPTAPNNAVLGGEAGHPLFSDLLARMQSLTPAARKVRYALGTHLLQRAVSEFRGPGLTVLPPPVFFPLGPEISEHWFRTRADASLDDVVGPETLLVHWYASVRTRRHVARLDAAFVRDHAKKQLFSALVLPTVRALADESLVRGR